MAHSPSYSPVEDSINLHYDNSIPNPIINPFYFAQDRESWDNEVAANACNESLQNKVKEQTLKQKKKSKSFKNKSFITRKKLGRARQLIKIMVYDLGGSEVGEIDTDPDNATINVQYIVGCDYDEIGTETEELVSKIVRKLGSTS